MDELIYYNLIIKQKFSSIELQLNDYILNYQIFSDENIEIFSAEEKCKLEGSF